MRATYEEFKSVSKTVITGWIIELVGMALWLYGYFATGNPPLIDWHASTPWWIADYLPNIESEIGMVLVFAGMIPLYWPTQK
jgi:protein-S-isoprenylcysteine O-methyltransferase Ste14